MTTTPSSPREPERAEGVPSEARRARVAEVARFLVGGISTTLVSYAIYVALLRWLAYPVAYGIAYVAGIAWSYAANTLFVFRTRPSLRRAAMFPFVYVAQYVVGTALLVALVDGAGVPRALAPAVVIVVTIPMTYLLSKRILHGRRRNETIR